MAAKMISELRYARPAKSGRLTRARALATEIAALLGAFAMEDTKGATASFAYQVRLAKGLTQSLIDQLEDLERALAYAARAKVD